MLTPQISPPLVGGDEGKGETVSFDPPPPSPSPIERGRGEKIEKNQRKEGIRSLKFKV
jgi:hypothetical protein